PRRGPERGRPAGGRQRALAVHQAPQGARALGESTMVKTARKALAAVNTEGWMMSYADMATILLAMFIVLSTLGKDQTGASLQKGLESWRASRQFFGLNGLFNNSNMQTQLGHRGPHYVYSQDDGEGGAH